ncbi:ribosomal RNA small subunit methyltransferase A [Candidatus Saccharibacteria bacterium RIFCSPHIGHO2_12_FULL_41_12]|nr:MAG: ribosomal RNA small subunit methyltransferase A [Candidatus Saccharibacteria bacterium RIFCSPHIGHO2_12_FULL_41_12]
MDGVFAKKALGQHWLNDSASLESIVDFANLDKDDFVLEVGPGHGVLTRCLVDRAAEVLAVEFDDLLASTLESKVKANNLKVINQDILKFDFVQLPKDFKIVANIPYYLTSKLIRNITQSKNLPSVVVLLIQKEVAQRLVGKDGDMSLLSLAAKIHFDVSLGTVVGRKSFDPPPKVDSQVVKLARLDHQKLADSEVTSVFRLAKAAFNSKRKTLLNSLQGGLNVEKSKLEEISNKYQEIDLTLRPQNLQVDDWKILYNVFLKEGLL